MNKSDVELFRTKTALKFWILSLCSGYMDNRILPYYPRYGILNFDPEKSKFLVSEQKAGK